VSYTVLYHNAVKLDISEAKDWYKSRRLGLEKRFSAEVKNAIIQLSEDPYLFEKKYKEVRVVYTKIFPFGVHYYLNETTKIINVLGVFHTSLSPDKWDMRLSST